MKTLLSILIPLVVLSACQKKIGQFDIDYDTPVIISSTVGQLIPFSVVTPEQQTNSEFEFESNDTKKKHIRSIYANILRLEITSPSNETFSFLNDLEVFISSPNKSEQKVAFVNDIPSNVGTVLNCSLVNIDLQEYIKEDRFTLRLLTTTDETIPEDVHVNVYTNFRVDAKLLK